MTRKKVLIITYYWPPSGGSGVQRWVKFTKYLRDFGWEPIIYTPLNPEFPAIDNSLKKDIPEDLLVLKRTIWEPYALYKKFVGVSADSKIGTSLSQEEKHFKSLHSFSIWIRGNFFIPDARKFWIAPSIAFLKSYILKNPIDVIVSNGPPHSMHMIGLGIKKEMNIPWLADFRDPWTNIDFFEDLKLMPWARRKHEKMEKDVLRAADVVTVTSEGTKKEFLRITKCNVKVITNGFDLDDFNTDKPQLTHKFTLSHFGMISRTRNYHILWEVLSELIKENNDFANHFLLRLYGQRDMSVDQAIFNFGLDKYVEKIDYIPHRDVMIEEQKSWILLLLTTDAPNANITIPGKVFEYMAAKRPIISLGLKNGDTAKILRESKAGETFSKENKESLKKYILKHFKYYLHYSNIPSNCLEINKYTRHNLTKKLALILNHLC